MDEYMKLLAAHDWYYFYSDDSRVNALGRDSWNRICTMAKTYDPDHRILKGWSDNIGKAV